MRGTAQTVPQALGHLRVALDDSFRRASREHGLTPSQAELLCAAMVPTSVAQLAAILRCDRTNIAHLMARAERHGWTERRADARDRRSALISLTPDGRALAERFLATLEAQLAGLLAGWNHERRRAAVSIVRDIAEALDAANQPAATVSKVDALA